VHSSKIPSPISNCRESSAWFLVCLHLLPCCLPCFLASSRLLLSFFSWGHRCRSSSFSSFYYSFFFLPPSLISLPYFLSFSSFGSKCSLFLSLPLINFLSLSGFSSLYVHTCNCMEILTYSILFSLAFFFQLFSGRRSLHSMIGK
jgi:hypothetical protein